MTRATSRFEGIVNLDELKSLLANATPGPWHKCGCGKCCLIWHKDSDSLIWPADCEDVPVVPDTSENSALIVALRNAAPALIAEVDHLRFAVRALNDTDRLLREQLEDMGHELETAQEEIRVLMNNNRIACDELEAARKVVELVRGFRCCHETYSGDNAHYPETIAALAEYDAARKDK